MCQICDNCTKVELCDHTWNCFVIHCLCDGCSKLNIKCYVYSCSDQAMTGNIFCQEHYQHSWIYIDPEQCRYPHGCLSKKNGSNKFCINHDCLSVGCSNFSIGDESFCRQCIDAHDKAMK